MKRSLTVAALVLTIFLLGIITGLVLPRPWLYRANSVDRPAIERQGRMQGEPGQMEGSQQQRQMEDRMMNGLLRRLDLKEEQKAPFKALLENQRKEMRKNMAIVRESTRAKLDSINVVLDLEVAKILNEEQLETWARFKKQMDKKGPRRN
jgi:hypothetical protein